VRMRIGLCARRPSTSSSAWDALGSRHKNAYKKISKQTDDTQYNIIFIHKLKQTIMYP
jgi:hypothetical protein